MEQKPRENETR